MCSTKKTSLYGPADAPSSIDQPKEIGKKIKPTLIKESTPLIEAYKENIAQKHAL